MAEHGDAAVDLVGVCQASAAPATGLALATVDQKFKLEVAAFAGAGAVVAEGGAFRTDRLYGDRKSVV